jgi:hypothetical protein
MSQRHVFAALVAAATLALAVPAPATADDIEHWCRQPSPIGIEGYAETDGRAKTITVICSTRIGSHGLATISKSAPGKVVKFTFNAVARGTVVCSSAVVRWRNGRHTQTPQECAPAF